MKTTSERLQEIIEELDRIANRDDISIEAKIELKELQIKLIQLTRDEITNEISNYFSRL